MKSTLTAKNPLRCSLWIVLLICAAISASAQVPTTPGQINPVNPVKQEQDLANYRSGLNNAIALATAKNLVAAEAVLTALNKSKPNTAEWHMEAAQRLMQVAEALAREGHPANVTALAASAVTHLNQAQPLTKNTRTQATAKSLEGSIQERYLADPTTALVSYQIAAQLSPATATKATEAADRLQKTNDNLSAKRAGGG
jgi:hypothetical protein